MLRADVSGIDSRLLEQRVRQELAAHPDDPAAAPAPGPAPAPPPPVETPPLAPAAASPAAGPPAPETPAPESPRPASPGSASPGPESPPPESPAKPPSGDRPGGAIARATAGLVAWYHRHSRHHQLQRRISELWAWAGETADRVHDLSRQIDALRLQLSALGDQHRELAADSRARFAERGALNDARHDEHGRRLDRLDHAAVRLQGDLRFEHRRLARLIEAAGVGGTAATPAGAGPTAPGSLSIASELSGRFAQGFEERFRGSREDIKERLRVHLDRVRGQPVVSPRHPLLDIGCGRGEWLELLAEAGVPAYGIDGNAYVVEACQRRGLAVSQADALQHLSRLPDGALGAISAIHVIEHLALEDMLRLIDEARRILVPDGILLLETPNPENLKVGALTFHQDPTHLRPLPPVLVEYLVASRGFHRVELTRLHPYPEAFRVKEDSEAARRLNELLCGPQDFAVLARRA